MYYNHISGWIKETEKLSSFFVKYRITVAFEISS